jgi:transcription elongation factor Elf1
MSDYIDQKYLNLLSSRVELFKRKTDSLYNFRCPYCGDSQKNRTKARGYVMTSGAHYTYKCHNCGISASFSKLLKHVDPEFYKEYSAEKFLNKGKRTLPQPKRVQRDYTKFSRPSYTKETPFKEVKNVAQLPAEHPVKKYVLKRRIPNPYHNKLYFVPKFMTFANKFVPGKFSEEKIGKDEPRLVIPFLDTRGNLFGFQGRALVKNSKIRYITIIFNDDVPKIYGLDTVDWSKTVNLVEGPIDSMFLENSLAMMGSSLNADDIFQGRDVVYIYDNEPRNKDIVKLMDKTISKGYQIVIWPKNVEEKDINDMVLANRDVDEIQAIISNNTFKGLSAMAKLSEWRKV